MKKIHSFYLLIMSFVLLIFILFSIQIRTQVSLYLILIILFFISGLKFKTYLKLFLISLLMGLSIVFLNFLYPSHALLYGPTVMLFDYPVHQAVIDNSHAQLIRLFLMSNVSLTSSFVIDFTQLLMFLMQNKILKVIVGYPILMAINSISLIKDERERISIIAKFRGIPWHKRLFIFLPLLVFAIRHSQRGAMALTTRGFCEDKTYFYDYSPKTYDHIFFSIFNLITLALLFNN